MPSGRFHVDAPVSPATALGRGRRLLDAVSAGHPVALYGAPLDAAAVVLGAYQHPAHALRHEALATVALPIVARRTGGAAVLAAPGVLYTALALNDASALMACPPGRVLNRNVRGFMAGIRALGVPAHYFGRDFVSAAAEPFAYVGWAERADGRVLLEFFTGVESTFGLPPGFDGYPERREPALRGKPLTTLRDKGASTAAADVLAAIADGYAKAHAVVFERAPLPEVLRTAGEAPAVALNPNVRANGAHVLHWSVPHEDAIGFASAGLALTAGDRVSALELCGDFFQHDACPEQLAAQLVGRVPTPEVVGAALDAAYASRPGLIEGLRSLNTLRDAILDALERARADGKTRN